MPPSADPDTTVAHARHAPALLALQTIESEFCVLSQFRNTFFSKIEARCTMKSAPPLTSSSPLVWTQPTAMSRVYELRSSDSLIGHLRFEGFCGSLASAEVASQKWSFKRVGFLAPCVIVGSPNREADIAVFRRHWGSGGALHFADGHRARWRCTNFWGSRWAFVGSDNHIVLRFSHHEGFFKASAQLEFERSSAALPEFPLLAALGWYLMILGAEDAAAAASVVA